MSNPKNTTIVYLTNNTENEKFETKVKEQLLANSGGLPIISVSRKRIKFGKNFSVGEVPISESTRLKMLQKGLEMANTEFAIIAEADCVYPPEYFSFSPPAKNIAYLYGNVWTLGGNFWKKKFLDGALSCNRKFWISKIKTALKGQKGWKQIDVPPVFEITDSLTWKSENPVVRIVTTNTTNKFTNVIRGVFPKSGLPYWGSAADLKAKLMA